MLGILLIHKPEGCSSHDVVNRVRRRTGTRRVGHAGTLDPLATGLLVVAVGPATRFLQYLPLEPKEYVAEIAFGQATTTQDREGPVTTTGEPPSDLQAALEGIKTEFLGLIEQVPPIYSAVKKDGKPLYAYARAGREVEREPRTVYIGALDILEVSGAIAKVRIVCSGGTYVRTLAHDIGAALGCGAHLHLLVRTGVGKFRLEQAVPLDEVEPGHLIPLSEALLPMPIQRLGPEDEAYARDGRRVGPLEYPDETAVGFADAEGRVFGIARSVEGYLQPEVVMPREAMHDPS